MKKSIIKIIIAILSVFTFSFSTLTPAMADNNSNYNSCRYFLGMVSWDCNTKLLGEGQVDSDQLTEGIVMIAFNILSDISVIAAYLALGFVIYGGYSYIFSAGDPSKVVTGKRTLTQAFIGLAIVMSASIILNAIRIALGANFSADCTQSNVCYSYEDANLMIDNFVGWIIGIAGVVSVAFIVYGGIAYMTSNGEPNKLQKAKSIILYALIGLVIVALARIITAFASNVIRQANNEVGYTNIIAIKELNEK